MGLSPQDITNATYDPHTKAMSVIDRVQRILHEGLVYRVSGKITGWENAAVEEYLIRTPAGSNIHWQHLHLSLGRGDIDIEMFEGPTSSADGASLASSMIQPNRQSSNTPTALLFYGPTITDDGTLLHTTWFPPTASGVGQSASGLVGVTPGEEWVLAAGTDYLVRLTNNSGATITYGFEALWSELDWSKAGS